MNWPEEKLTPKEAADFLGVTTETLSVWRCDKRYDLPYIKIGSKVFYLKSDVENFIKSRRICKYEDSKNERTE